MFVKKTVSLLVTLATISSATAVPRANTHVGNGGAVGLSKRIWGGSQIWSDCNTTVREMEPIYFKELGSRRVKITYGSFVVPATSDNSGMMEWTVQEARKPCDNCLVYEWLARAEYPDSTEANFNTGMMLHHTRLRRQDKKAITCPSIDEEFFATGNERGAMNIGPHSGHKNGYLYSDKPVTLMTELMNTHDTPREVLVSIEYEFMEKNFENFTQVEPLWLNAPGLCHDENVPVPADRPKFNLTLSEPFTMPFPGFIGGVGGHVHDGATNLQVIKNGTVMCNLVPGYGERPEFVDEMGMSHISSVPICTNLGVSVPGDTWDLNAVYDFEQHEPMADEAGHVSPIMAVYLAFVARLPPS